MATFGKWLLEQKDREDSVGSLARTWLNDRTRGNISSVKGAKQHMQQWESWDACEPILSLAVTEYHQSRNPDAVPLQPPPWAQGATGHEDAPPDSPREEGWQAVPGFRGGVVPPGSLTTVGSSNLTITGTAFGGGGSGGGQGGREATEEELARFQAMNNPPGRTDQDQNTTDEMRAAAERRSHELQEALDDVVPVIPAYSHDGTDVVVYWATAVGQFAETRGTITEEHANYVVITEDSGEWVLIPWARIGHMVPRTVDGHAIGIIETAMESMARPAITATIATPSDLSEAERLAALPPDVAMQQRQEAHHKQGEYLPGSYVAEAGLFDNIPPQHGQTMYSWPDLFAAADHDAAG